MRGWAPCGACGAYVLLTEGCQHWPYPGETLTNSQQRARRYRERKALEALRLERLKRL